MASLLFHRTFGRALGRANINYHPVLPLPRAFFTSSPIASTTRLSLAAPTNRVAAFKLSHKSSELNILQFIRNKIRHATHRGSRFPSISRSHNSRRSHPLGFLESIPPKFILWGVAGLNIIVFLMWGNATASWRNGNPGPHIWMRENFTSSLSNVKASRLWCLITSCFSHENTSHILFNGLAYFGMAPAVLAILGNASFLTLYLGGGIFADLASITWNNGVKHRDIPSHGASAAIYAVISFMACVHPTASFLIFGIVPVPAWVCVAGLFAFDGYSTITDKQTTTDTAGHVAGLIAGAGYFLLRRFGIFRL